MIPDRLLERRQNVHKLLINQMILAPPDAGLGERVDECADGAGQARVFRFEAHRGVLKCVGRREILNGAGPARRRQCPLDIREGRLEQRTLLRVELRDARQLVMQVAQRLLQVVHRLSPPKPLATSVAAAGVAPAVERADAATSRPTRIGVSKTRSAE